MHPTLESFTLLGPTTLCSTTAQLDAAEAVIGMPIPASYREFAGTLGHGRFFPQVGLLLLIPIDFPGSLTVQGVGLAEFFVEMLEQGAWELEPDGSPELVRRFVPFGISENGDYFAWDPDDPSGPDEHWIYHIGLKMLSVTRAAPDLYELLESCTDERVKPLLGMNLDPMPRIFEPLTPMR